jgi:photosystem II stability/assembly factor-like uncharacterized protein
MSTRCRSAGFFALVLFLLAPLTPRDAGSPGTLALTAQPTPTLARGSAGMPGQEAIPATDALLQGFRWRSIGPANIGGRIDEIAVVEQDTRIIFKGFATGGLFRTTNNGVTWEQVFEGHGTSSIGSVAVSQSNPDIVWVATGEANNRQSSSFGDGVYKSVDGGLTFRHMGLRETQSVNRLVIHPTDPDIVWVAAGGGLFAPSPDRGIFKTTDGGASWRKVAYVDEDTGFTEIVVNHSNPDILFAASYQRRRTSWGFVGGGPGSGIWKSVDGGETWQRLSGSGLPRGTLGRVAMDIHRANPDIIYAQIEVAADREEPVEIAAQVAEPGQEQLPFLCGRRAAEDPECSGVWRSMDGGSTWEFRSNHNVRPMYFSVLKVDPNDPEVLYTGGVQFYQSTDGGKTFNTVPGPGHVDHHAIWINPANSDHLIIGNDGGMDMTYDRGQTWESFRTLAVGQFYYLSMDMRRPYWVYGGLQDNGTWGGPSSTRSGPTLNADWMSIGGGDGFYTAVDTVGNNTIYYESQNGNVQRLDLRTGRSVSIRPRGPTNQDSVGTIRPAPPEGTGFRWNWNTPLLLSPHNPRVVYTGANRFFKSMDRGETWTMSEDLTKQVDRDTIPIMGVELTLPNCTAVRGRPCILSRHDGVSNFGTIITISESPVVPGVLWVGTDDGNVQVSRDGGSTWANVGRNIPGPQMHYVSRVEASNLDAATAYVSLDGHRTGDLRPYVYVTRDYGATWTSIAADLPEFGNVNVVRQDPKNPRLLYAGTEFGFFVSLDEGGSWVPFTPGMPAVRVDHLAIHPRENDLVLATHARSIWIMDDVTALQQLTPEVLAEDVHLFEPREAVAWMQDRRYSRSLTGAKEFRGQNAPPGTAIQYYLRTGVQGNVQVTISDVAGRVVRSLEGPGGAGIQRVQWNLLSDPPERPTGALQQAGQQRAGPRVDPGTYLVRLRAGGRELTRTVVVLEDIWMPEW